VSITTIVQALTGERVVALSPENAGEAATDWLRRPNLFPGRALTVAALQERQRWQAGHIAQRGQAFTPGVARGLEVGYVVEGVDERGHAIVRLRIGDGQGLAVSGEDVVLVRQVECLLSALPVVAPPSVFIDVLDADAQQAADDDAIENADPTPGAPLPRAIGPTLGELIAHAPDRLPPVGILVLQPVTVDTADLDPDDPCDRCPCDDGGAGSDPASFEDWRIADGVRLLWYAWPQEWLALPLGSRLRNELVHRVFDTEGSLQHGEVLPWEGWGVPIALIGVDANWQPLFADRASVVRQGGRARDPRLQLAAPETASLAANSRLPALWQARIEQFAEQVAAAGEPAPDASVLAQGFARLPPCGLLPKNAMDLQNLRSEFFPMGFDIDAAPVPVDQLDLALRASAGLAPFNLSNAESVRMLVPVPQAVWEPRLLMHEAVAPEFQQTLEEFLLVRARMIGARQGMRIKQAVLTHAINGTTPVVPDFNVDADALEVESLSPWGPPPAEGGHRSSVNAGLHQHYFQDATETLAVDAGDGLYCWVYLDPENPPSTLMLQWRTGDWEHRAYWGDNLIALGEDGTASRLRIGDLPAAGEWVRLEVPAASVGLGDAAVNGMAFTLYGGRAAYAATGTTKADGVEQEWFGNVLPKGAQEAGDEAWDLITENDLWAPFEAPFSVLTAAPATVPAGGGHVEPPARSVHQHFFDSATTPFTAAAGEQLFCWAYLDPNNPPREVMLQWHTTAEGWEHRAYWGANLINWGNNGSVSRLRAGDLPAPGGWVRLEVPAAGVGLTAAAIKGMAFTLFDGCAAFGAAGALGTAAGGAERPWFSGALPAGAVPHGIWNFLTQRELVAPTPASQVGQVEILSDLVSDPSLAGLSGQERSQLPVLGLEGFIAYLKSRADRADDLVDYGFVKVQTDIYRIRQLMLGTTAASRLAVSPALATIAQADTAVASQAQIASFLADLKTPAPKAMPVAGAAAGGGATTSKLAMEAGSKLNIDSSAGAFGGFSLNLTTSAKLLEAKTTIAPIFKRLGVTPLDITNAAPLIGKSFVRTTAIAKRMEDPKAEEARDYATSSRMDAVHGLLRLADTLIAEDSGVMPGLFSGVELHGLDGDTFLGEGNTTRKRAFADFIDKTKRDTLLPALLTVPVRKLPDGTAIDPDEASRFSDSTDLSDHVIALMRQMEGRIKLYRDAISVCQSVLDGLKKDANGIQARIAVIVDDLAEARHDVSVAQALLAEETDRIDGINTRRATVLSEQVRFLAFVRPREADNLLTAPRRDLDPGLIDAPVPTCLKDHSDIPDDLQEMLRVVREAPANWFVTVPKLVDRLDRPDLLIKALQSAQIRTQIKTMLPLAGVAAPQNKVANAVMRVAARQTELLGPRVEAIQRLNLASLVTATWQGVRSQATQLVSLGDLIDGAHGRSQIARQAADEFDRIGHIAACLHAEFSGVLPSIRLDWAETLSEFDAAPNLRNLGSLARWSEVGYIDRRQMQSYVDWLFAQIDPQQTQGESMMNDVVRMCLLLASHAPVDRIIAGRMKQPVTGVRPGVRLPLTVFDPSRLRVGMQALMVRAGSVVARAIVEDIGSAEVSARVIHTTATQVDLGDDVRVQFSDAAAVSLGSVKTAMTKALLR
jgi:hypothetical protein